MDEEYLETVLDLVDRIELTRVHARVEGDTFFPDFDRERFRETSRIEHPADARNGHAMSFVTLERRSRPGTQEGKTR